MPQQLKTDILLGLVALTIGGLAATAYSVSKSTPVNLQTATVATPQPQTMSQNSFTREKGRYKAEFGLGERLTNERFIATAIIPMGGHPIEDAGSNSTMAALTPKAADKYVKKYPGTKICPASFFNSNANHINLFAANDKTARILKSWDRRKYTVVPEWEAVRIKGRCVTGLNAFYDDGVDITGDVFIDTTQGNYRCLSIWVEDIVITPANLFQ